MALPAGDVYYWHEHRVGLAAQLADAVLRLLAPFLVSLAGVFLLVLLAAGAAESSGLPHDLGVAIDLFGRAAMLPLCGLGYAGWAVWIVAVTVRRVGTSRRLARIAGSRSAATAVPAPEQLMSVVSSGSGWIVFVALHGLMAVVALIVAPFQGQDAGFALAIAAYFVVASGLPLVVAKILARPLQRWRVAIAGEWAGAPESAAWTRAVEAVVPDAPAGRHVVRAARWLEGIGIPLVFGGWAAFVVQMYVRYPQATTVPGDPDSGPRHHYSAGIEHVLTTWTWLSVAALTLGLLTEVAGMVVAGIAKAGERGMLRRAVSDPTAERPPLDALDRAQHGWLSSLPSAAAVVSAAGLAVSLAEIDLGNAPVDRAPDGWETVSWHGGSVFHYGAPFAHHLDLGWVVLCASLGLLVLAAAGIAVDSVANRSLRNELLRRWPIRPVSPVDEDGNPIDEGREGPVLS